MFRDGPERALANDGLVGAVSAAATVGAWSRLGLQLKLGLRLLFTLDCKARLGRRRDGRDSNRLHLFFFLGCFALLVSTLWRWILWQTSAMKREPARSQQ